jgi:hypothetical protein
VKLKTIAITVSLTLIVSIMAFFIYIRILKYQRKQYVQSFFVNVDTIAYKDYRQRFKLANGKDSISTYYFVGQKKNIIINYLSKTSYTSKGTMVPLKGAQLNKSVIFYYKDQTTEHFNTYPNAMSNTDAHLKLEMPKGFNIISYLDSLSNSK